MAGEVVEDLGHHRPTGGQHALVGVEGLVELDPLKPKVLVLGVYRPRSGDVTIRHPLGGKQHDTGTLRLALRARLGTHPPLQLNPLVLGDLQRRHAPHTDLTEIEEVGPPVNYTCVTTVGMH